MSVPLRPSARRLCTRARATVAQAAIAALLAAGCGGSGGDSTDPGSSGPAGPVVHLHETHSSALVAWRQDGVQGRVLVHLDAEPDLDWLPDETIARIAASHSSELARLEAQPFELTEDELAAFGSGNFLYAASRLGIIKEIVWVVPDGTLGSEPAARRVIEELLVGRMQMLSEAEAASFRTERNRIHGVALGIPITVCQLDDLPPLPDGVLLDVDSGYLTRPSALSPKSERVPWIDPPRLTARLLELGVRPDVVTISLSTLDGEALPDTRWIARDLQESFRGVPISPEAYAARRMADAAERSGDPTRAAEIYLDLAVRRPDDATVWYSLARAFDRGGRGPDARSARDRAERLDPLLTHADLFEAEQLWHLGDFAGALNLYDAYLFAVKHEGFAAYAQRQRALCLLRAGRVAEGTDALAKIIDAYPNHARGRFEMGLALYDHGRRADAAPHFLAARELAPDVATYSIALGAIYLEQSRTVEGIRELERAITLRPCSVQARARLVPALVKIGRNQEAAAHMSAALQLQPENPRLRLLSARLSRALSRGRAAAP